MSYASPRPAKLLKPLTSKLVGQNKTKDYKIGKVCTVQRNPSQPGMFIVWFGRYEIAQVAAEDLTSTIEYTDGKPEGFNF